MDALIEFLYYSSLSPNGCLHLLHQGGVRILSNFLSNSELRMHQSIIRSTLKNIRENAHCESTDPLPASNCLQNRELTPNATDAVCDIGKEDFGLETFVNQDKISIQVDGVPRDALRRKASRSNDRPKRFRVEYLPKIHILQKDCDFLSEFLRTLMDVDNRNILPKLRYFATVVLHDYPIELILQKPVFIKLLSALLAISKSMHVQEAAVDCLIQICHKITARIHYFANPDNYRAK
uniref:Protein SDA1 n=2 Tax=Mesocestoides corti TaxID=53468 RepID=A0A5K3FVD6_MESCO